MFYNRKEVKDLISYLKLIVNENDDIALSRTINSPKRGIGLKTVGNIASKADMNNTSIFEAITDGKELEFKKTIQKLKELKENIEDKEKRYLANQSARRF